MQNWNPLCCVTAIFWCQLTPPPKNIYSSSVLFEVQICPLKPYFTVQVQFRDTSNLLYLNISAQVHVHLRKLEHRGTGNFPP